MHSASETPPVASPFLGRWLLLRPELTVCQGVLLVALYIALTQNYAFLRAVWDSLPHPYSALEWRITGSVVVTLYAFVVLVLLPVSGRRIFKPAAVAFLTIAAICSYFMDTFGSVINKSMITNVVRTDAQEAADLLRPGFFFHVFLQGVLPGILLTRCEFRNRGFWRESLSRMLAFSAVLICVVSLMAAQYSELAFWGRENRNVRLYLNPMMPISAVFGFVRETLASGPPKPPTPIATDAVRVANPGARPFLMVLVVGETARAANFQLNGYGRETNARLSQIPELINYPNVSSCGTATAESVPCMFSLLQRQEFSRSKAEKQENILDVLQRVGVEVHWRDNDSGCQEVCRRVSYLSLEKVEDPSHCDHNGCRDGVLLRALDEQPLQAGAARLLVLHQKGSHGPAYFKRYPEPARRFTPDCRDENVHRCSRQETVNAYDNTIAYTDEVLAELIEHLRARQEQVDSVLVYLSDHGESLGENGVYLHGLPYAIAPKEQTHVPMMAWFSAQAPAALGLNLGCIRNGSGKAYSHDNLFPSLLGLFSVKTAAYDPVGDLFSACRRSATALGNGLLTKK